MHLLQYWSKTSGSIPQETSTRNSPGSNFSLRIDHVLKSPRLTLFLVAETKLSLSTNLIWA